MSDENIQNLVKGIKEGNRVALSKAITLAESTLSGHQIQAQNLIQQLLPETGKAKRIAITGVPGAGKSTFIETFGKILTDKNLKVAVLAIDPSSSISGGSILGDKTRMEDLARNPLAYIRPSATGGFLGGITSRTYEAMLLCEAAGFDVILIETVGVGQSETLVHGITDLFIFLQLPGGGDDLQGIKRGIMEMSDIIFVNKVDDFGMDKSKEVKLSLARSLEFLPKKESGWKRKVILGSGLTGKGLNEIWDEITNYYSFVNSNNYLEELRKKQNQFRVKEYIKELLTRKALDQIKEDGFETVNSTKSLFFIAENWIAEKLGINL